MRKIIIALTFALFPLSAFAASTADPVQLGFLSATTTGTAGCTTLGLGKPPCFVPYSATNPIAISGGGGGGTGTVTSLTAGTGLSSSPATITTTGSYSLLNATTTTLGGIIVGNGLAVSTTGVVSASGSSSLSALTSGTATNTIDNTLFGQTWTWNSLTTQTALSFTSSTLTTGTVLSAVTSAVGNTGYAGYFSNTSTAGYALYVNGNCFGCYSAPSLRKITTGLTDTSSLSDQFISWNSTSYGAKTETIPSASGAVRPLIYKDEGCTAGTQNITISPATGTIDQGPSILISINCGSVSLLPDAANNNWMRY